MAGGLVSRQTVEDACSVLACDSVISGYMTHTRIVKPISMYYLPLEEGGTYDSRSLFRVFQVLLFIHQ